MSEILQTDDNLTTPQALDQLSSALEDGRLQVVKRLLMSLHPAEIAHLLESLPRNQRNALWELTDPEEDGEILLNVNDEVRATLIRRMETQEVVEALEGLAVDDLADVIEELPNTVINALLEGMDEQQRRLLEAVRSWPEDSAGGLMDADLVTIRPNVNLDVVLRFVRKRGSLPDGTDSLFVVDRFGKYRGMLPLSELLTHQPDKLVAEVLITGIKPIKATAPASKVVARFEDHDLVSAPVVNDENELIGRITIDDVVDVIRDEAEHSILSMAGLDEEEDMFAPATQSARRRGIWLGVNLLTALIASWVVGIFEATIAEVVALAVLMPVVASMGGIAGSQTLTLVIRSQALDQISRSNARQLLRKEMGVGFLNGVAWSLVVAGITYFWFESFQLGAIIAAAILINMFVAAVAGFSIPLLLKKLSIDPALAGSVVLTTVTDVVGFMAFLGLGAWYLSGGI